MTTPEPVTGATQDPREPALNDLLEALHEGADYAPLHILSLLDAADAAAGIRRVPAEEAVEPSEAEAAAAMEAVSYLNLAELDLLDAVYDALRAAARVRIGGAS